MNDAARTPVPLRIGVFDSGVGGLSVLGAVRARLPDAEFHYCSDNLNFPYGPRAEDDVVRCVMNANERFMARCALDLLVVACNTASTVTLPALRARWTLPVVGVVPAIKPAAAASRTKVIGLLATPGTVRFKYTDGLVAEHAADCRVVRVGSVLLVQLAEQKLRGEPIDLEVLRAEIAPLFEPGLDAAVLGCTHFPLLLPEIQAVSPWKIQWFDSAQAIAARVASLLEGRGATEGGEAARRASPPRAWFTAGGASVEALRPALAALGFGGVEVL